MANGGEPLGFINCNAAAFTDPLGQYVGHLELGRPSGRGEGTLVAARGCAVLQLSRDRESSHLKWVRFANRPYACHYPLTGIGHRLLEQLAAEVHAGWCPSGTSNPAGLPMVDRSVRFRHTSAILTDTGGGKLADDAG